MKLGRPIIQLLSLGSVLVLLAACGGGGGGGSSSGGSAATYTVGGSVSGLSGTLVLRNNGGDDLTPSGDGAFSFATAMADQSGYSVAVAIQPANQACTVTNGSGTIAGVNVTSVTVACAIPPPSGSLDTGFDTDGKVTTNLGSDIDDVVALALQSDGKIVAVGNTLNSSGDPDFALARYNADGGLDKTGFGASGDGIVKTGFPNGSDYARAVAIYPSIGQSTDGMIVVVGHSYSATSGEKFALARYKPDGTLDTGFGAAAGAAGLVKTGFSGTLSVANAVAIQSDGKIIAAGTDYGASYDFALARYNTDGTLDATFGTGGKVTTDISGFDEVYAISIQSDDKIVVAGYTTNTISGNRQAIAARYTVGDALMPDGSLDPNFGTGGMAKIGIDNEQFYALAIQPADGKIVAAGYSGPTGFRNMYVVRFKTDGTLDNSSGFGLLGSGNAYASFVGGDSEARGIAIQLDGKIVVTGYADNGAIKDIAFARFDTTGVLDSSFDTDGKVTIDLGSSGEIGNAVAIQSDGNIVAVASPVVTVNGNDFALVRVNP